MLHLISNKVLPLLTFQNNFLGFQGASQRRGRPDPEGKRGVRVSTEGRDPRGLQGRKSKGFRRRRKRYQGG
jgi:hypothetical protein